MSRAVQNTKINLCTASTLPTSVLPRGKRDKNAENLSCEDRQLLNKIVGAINSHGFLISYCCHNVNSRLQDNPQKSGLWINNDLFLNIV